ncbi:MAG: hypothetical protein WC959_08835 [Kiritimatiellales bacterium]
MNTDKFLFSLVGRSSYDREMASVRSGYRAMLVNILETILDRYDRNPEYHFIDTKFSLITGQDFADDDPVRGKNTIYSWIQGRGLEALAGHIRWLQQDPEFCPEETGPLIRRSRRVLAEVFSSMESLRSLNGGRLYFFMTPAGQALRMDSHGHVVPYNLQPDSPSNFSDLFYIKGMAAAAYTLGLKEKLIESMQWFQKLHNDIKTGNFVTDQQQLDPKNTAARFVEDRNAHGVYMISISAIALFLKCGGNPEFKQAGFEFLDHVLSNYVNLDGKSPLSEKYDMWEFVNKNGDPFIDERNVLLNDPGHACEFSGISMDMIDAMENHTALNEAEQNKIKMYKQILPEMIKKNFSNGFSAEGRGISKAVDLISRKTINSDMPWWSLPETMRAAAFARHYVPAEKKACFEEIIAKCSNAFIQNYVQPELNQMAFQVIDKNGIPVNTIPATPDADPAYHTGLSLIDFLRK